jgi:hypothetical protein
MLTITPLIWEINNNVHLMLKNNQSINNVCLFQINVLIDTGSSNFAVAASPSPDIDLFFKRKE